MAGWREIRRWRMRAWLSRRRVSADLENGFGDAPEVVADTIRLAAEVGLVGCTIEDTTGNPDHPLYEIGLATERIAAAAEAARALPFPFLLTARAHNLLYPGSSLNDTISRLQAFEQAGANVLFAPGLPDLAAVHAVCESVSMPVSFMAGIKGKSFSVGELTRAGVKRISLATSLYRAAMAGLLDAAREVRDTGEFSFLDRCVTTPELNELMRIWPLAKVIFQSGLLMRRGQAIPTRSVSEGTANGIVATRHTNSKHQRRNRQRHPRWSFGLVSVIINIESLPIVIGYCW
jgi:2-methylisocitrate lyase-like PEP mutase family enzyme